MCSVRTVVSAAVALLCSAAAVSAQPRLREDNIDQVISSMTLREKAAMVVGGGYRSMLAGFFGSKVPVPGAAGMTRGIERLGIPATVLSDGPAGVRIEPRRRGRDNRDRTFHCTGFPIGTLLACSWNTELVEEVGAALGNEALEYGVDVLLAPGMNLHRNPLCGRNFEYFSEDPLLSGKIAAAYVRGVQSNGVGTSVKHFAVNNQESNRFWNDSRVSEDVLRALYLRNFEIAVREAEPWTVMASYNRLNGIHTQMDTFLLTRVLRDEWGYRGLVMTDWVGRRDTDRQIGAGNDLMEPGTRSQMREVRREVRKGVLSEEVLDTSVRRVLELVVKTPTFKGHVPSNDPDLKAHASLARKAAEEGMVLLKNEGDALPLAPAQRVGLFGTSSYSLLAGGTGSGHVHRPYIIDIEDGLQGSGFEVDAAVASIYHDHLRRHRPKNTMMTRMLGAPAAPEMELGRDVIEGAVACTDVAVLTLARQSGEGGDRHLKDDFLLSDLERDMVETVCEVYHAAGKKVIVILNTGGVVETASWKDAPDAILLAWQPGEEGGNAIADVLSGVVNPSGKLSMTFPVDYFDLPSSANFPYDYHGPGTMFGGRRSGDRTPTVDFTDYAEGMDVGYRYFLRTGKEVSYPFGHGLSYTSFKVSDPVFETAPDGSETAVVTVTNTGSVAGREVVRVMREHLVAFAKTRLLQPGESQKISMELCSFQ